jgi:propionate CoA-transferase
MHPKARAKVLTADQAVAHIRDGQTLACSGFIGSGHPEALTSAIERRFLAGKGPHGLTLTYAAGQGDTKDRGMNHLAHPGLLKRVVGGHWGLAPKLGRLAITGQIEAYNFPQGVVCQLYRDIAAGRPGCITHVGLGTFIDPAHSGGRLNDRSTESLVERVELGGKTWLWYKAFPIHVGLLRGTAVDPMGNLVMDEETIIGDVLPIAQAARNGGGFVIAQVARLLDRPAPPHQVRVPGILIDYVVLARPHEHEQTFGEHFNPAYVTAADHDAPPVLEPLPMDERRIIAARACDELPRGAVVNLGIGMPEGIARIAAERRLLNDVTLTVESGPIGGMPAAGLSFGASVHPQAIIDQPAQFDLYDGRILDFAALGAAEIDPEGNVNVSRFGDRLAGVGGFVNITQTARRLVFCGTLTAGGLEIAVENGALRIVREGRAQKFVPRVEQLSFSAARSRQVGQDVLYVTERAVFRLTAEGLQLVEVAPGIDVETQVLARMAFRPIVKDVKPMPAHVFK